MSEEKTEKVKVKGFSRPITKEALKYANIVIEALEEKNGQYVKENRELLEKCKDKTTAFPSETILIMAALLDFNELREILKALNGLCSIKAVEEARRIMMEGVESSDPKKQREALQLAMLLTINLKNK